MKPPTLDQIKIDALLLGKLAAKLVENIERYENAAQKTSTPRRQKQADKMAEFKARLIAGKYK